MTPAAGVAAADWPQFLGPTRNGVSAEKDLRLGWEGAAPPRAWEREVGEGFSAPVVAGGQLIISHRLGDREVTECLDAASGRKLWSHAAATAYRDRFGFDNGPRATPAIAAGKVYTHGAEGTLTAVDLASGDEVWQVKTQEKYELPETFFGVACSPLVHDGKVFLNVGGAGGAGLVAFDADTGKEIWKATSHEASYASPVLATIGGADRVLFFTRDGLSVVDPAGGEVVAEVRWRARIHASVNAATPLALEPGIFLSSSYGVGAVLLELEGGRLEQVWASKDALTNHYATSVHHAGALYGFHGRQEYTPALRAIDAATGKVRWTEAGFGAGSLVVAGATLVILLETGELVLADASPDAYRERQRARVFDGTVRAFFAIAGGRLFARDEKRLACFDLVRPR